MSTGSVARRLIELCRAGRFNAAVDELYSDDARSIEMDGAGGPRGTVEGLSAIRKKGKAFEESYLKMHSLTVSDPLIAGSFFTIALGLDATFKDGGRRALKEVCVYEVRGDKIVREQFFYSPS